MQRKTFLKCFLNFFPYLPQCKHIFNHSPVCVSKKKEEKEIFWSFPSSQHLIVASNHFCLDYFSVVLVCHFVGFVVVVWLQGGGGVRGRGWGGTTVLIVLLLSASCCQNMNGYYSKLDAHHAGLRGERS